MEVEFISKIHLLLFITAFFLRTMQVTEEGGPLFFQINYYFK